ncbi:HNH endonuclease [Promicromonospora umidemergens]|uniref:HNH domain-containing protein n=1 Tax=Promicromonospora umidemergens TaxID=629679 RepID=A0ABP8XIF9_9MICO|nr:HNH endonuclease [Promicromonospora umidemergens]MCP2284868.1 HNH endonuclease [Promicromonospora umidemergens]
MGQVHNGHRWRKLVTELCPPGSWCEIEECWAPSREIQYGLRPRHPLGPSLDHIVEVWQGGAEYDPRNLRPSHLRCNVIKSNQLRAAARADAVQPRRQGRARAAAMGTSGRRRRSSVALD